MARPRREPRKKVGVTKITTQDTHYHVRGADLGRLLDQGLLHRIRRSHSDMAPVALIIAFGKGRGKEVILSYNRPVTKPEREILWVQSGDREDTKELKDIILAIKELTKKE